jgi:hypothetical protein
MSALGQVAIGERPATVLMSLRGNQITILPDNVEGDSDVVREEIEAERDELIKAGMFAVQYQGAARSQLIQQFVSHLLEATEQPREQPPIR